jgi:UDP-N-acetyl-2-amino-2-deoxyglucuronate dehydrogenase
MDESPGKWIMVAADTSTHVSYFNVPAEGVCTANLVFANGVRASIQCGGPDMEIWGGLRLTGEKGFFEIFWDGEFKEVRLYDDPSFRAPEVRADGDAQMRAMMTHILDCYETGVESEVSLQKAMRAAEIIFTGYESIRRRERLSIPTTGFTDNPIHAILTEMGRMPDLV